MTKENEILTDFFATQDAKAVNFMRQFNWPLISLDEWLHEHYDDLSKSQINEATVIIDGYYEGE